MAERKKVPPPKQQASSGLDPLLEHGLPANPDAERAVLGAILLDNLAYYNVAGKIISESFFMDQHRRIWGAIELLMESGVPVDYTTLTDRLQQRGELEAIGGVVYLSSLTDGLPRAINAEHYAAIVQEKAMARRLIFLGHSIVQASLENEASKEVLERAEASLIEISEGGRVNGQNIKTLSELTATSELDRLLSKQAMGLPTGFPAVDRRTTGFHPTDLDVLAGRPGMGKSSYMLDVCVNVATGYGYSAAALEPTPAAIFELEMSRDDVMRRVLARMARVNLNKLRCGVQYLTKDERVALSGAADRLRNKPLYIEDSSGPTVNDLRAKIRFLVRKYGIKLVAIDHLGLIATPIGRGGYENRNLVLSLMTKMLKNTAKDLGITVMLLCQLSRLPERRGNDHRPMLSDLRESGAIEEDADSVRFLYREEYYLQMKKREVPEDKKGRAELILAKQRHGATGTVPLLFLKEYSSFAPAAERLDENEQEAAAGS